MCARTSLLVHLSQLTPWRKVFLSELHSASQEFPHILWNPKVYYHAHKSPPLESILSQINPIHILQPYFHKIHSNIIFLSAPMYLNGLLPSDILTKSVHAFRISPMSGTYPAHLTLLEKFLNIFFLR